MYIIKRNYELSTKHVTVLSLSVMIIKNKPEFEFRKSSKDVKIWAIFMSAGPAPLSFVLRKSRSLIDFSSVSYYFMS